MTASQDGSVLVAYQRYGQGKALCLNASGLWRWSFRETGQEESEVAYARFWISLLQWLLSGSQFLPGTDVALTSARRYYTSEQPMQFLISIRNLDRGVYQPRLVFSGGTQPAVTVEPRPRGESFVAEAGPFPAGSYRVSLRNNIGRPAELEQNIEVVSASVEKRELSADPETMRQLAEISGVSQTLGSRAPACPAPPAGLGSLEGNGSCVRAAGHRMVAAKKGGPVMSRTNSRVLSALRKRLAGWRALGTVLLLVGIIGIAGFALATLDAALDLPESLRVAAPWLLGAAIIIVLGSVFWGWLRLTEVRLARLFETANPSLGNRLTNAVQLSGPATAGPVEAFLRQEAVQLGRETAQQVATWPAARTRVQLAAAVAGLAALTWIGLSLWPNHVLATVLPRFLDPQGDHPPYSQLRISVVPGRTQVLYGGQIEVRAQTSGRPADKLWLVARAGTNSTRALMFLAPDKSFFQTLVNLREPAEYFVTDGRARSLRYPISIRYTPQITLAEGVATFPEYTGKPPRNFRLGAEPQAFPEDTRVSLRIASNRPLKSGQLTLTPVLGGKATQVALSPEAQSNIVAGSFTLTQALALTLTIRDIDNLEGSDAVQARF